jgi:anti-sigma B factor antagonist
MRNEVREEGGRLVVALEGDVDLEHSPAARELLLEAVAGGRDVLVDLSAVRYIDSSGVASLVEAFQLSRKSDASFALVAVSPAALRVLQLSRLDGVFPIHATLAEALGGDA